MATTTMPPLSRLALLRPCDSPWKHPHPHRTEATHIRSRLASILCDAAPKRICLQFHENTQSWVPSSSTQNRASSQTSRRCSTGVPSEEQGSELDAAPAQGLAMGNDQDLELDRASAGSLEETDIEGGELVTASAARPLAQIEKDKQKSLGRALRAGKGTLIAELLQIFDRLLERPYGGGECVANAGGAVIERVVNDVQQLRGKEGVSDQVLFELLKVIRFLEMDMELVRAAKKEETLIKRLETAQMHCKQAYNIASSF
ncbi:hypothetical protein GOP47_0003409 [Adiantum capillus-veneris]|uniref:Uncharacterized protein n=1 Tax=Adiantum capillus-veneris TaxID=13818 RepID=A0A9D4ZRU2_ADICA|nr:hypothetical protein GOP47_0003409 [Adiantum capillus-veneris]